MELRANERPEARLPVAAEETWVDDVQTDDTEPLDRAAEQATLLRMAALVPERKQEMLPNGEEMNASDPRPLREYFLQHPSAEVRLDLDAVHAQLDFDAVRVQQTAEEYAALRDALAVYIPDFPKLHAPSLEALRGMTGGAVDAYVSCIMAHDFLHPVGVRFSVLAETLRAAPAEMFAVDDEGEDYAFAAK